MEHVRYITFAHLHGVTCSGLVSHDADVVRLRPNELDTMVVANVHERGVLRQEAVSLRMNKEYKSQRVVTILGTAKGRATLNPGSHHKTGTAQLFEMWHVE